MAETNLNTLLTEFAHHFQTLEISNLVICLVKNLLSLSDDESGLLWASSQWILDYIIKRFDFNLSDSLVSQDNYDSLMTDTSEIKSKLLDLITLINQILVLFLFGFSELEIKFKENSINNSKHRIRSLQSLVLSFILDLASLLISKIDHEACFKPLSLCLIWLGCNRNLMNLYIIWGDSLGLKSMNFEDKLHSTLKRIAELLNKISLVADMESCLEFIPSDVELMGSLIFKDFFKDLDQTGFNIGLLNGSEINETAILMSRVAWFGNILSADAVFLYNLENPLFHLE